MVDKEASQTIADADLRFLCLAAQQWMKKTKKKRRGLMRQTHHPNTADPSEENFSEQQNQIIGLSMSLCQKKKKKDGTILPWGSKGTVCNMVSSKLERSLR